jgi:hypothetical protein
MRMCAPRMRIRNLSGYRDKSRGDLQEPQKLNARGEMQEPHWGELANQAHKCAQSDCAQNM